ncbi:MAG: DUF559 domain-containing protein [bacterium]
MVASGWLRQVHAGVYSIGGPLSTEGRWMAAVLAAGEGAMLSHRSAGELRGYVEPIEGPIHVTARHGRRTHRGVVLHRTRWPEHPDRRHGMPVTTPDRTLLDLASTLTERELRRALEAADRLGELEPVRLSVYLAPLSGRRGLRRLRRLVAAYHSPTETRSELEREFLRLCRRAGIPAPATNVPLGEAVVDCIWPGARLVVELDGYAFHRSPGQFERDRRRDATLQLAGYRVLRFTSMRIRTEPESVVRQVQRGLDA